LSSLLFLKWLWFVDVFGLFLHLSYIFVFLCIMHGSLSGTKFTLIASLC
jgi:hypothetical protein